MPFLRGEDVNVGVAIEAVRGTYVEPQIWIPARTPAGIIAQLDKVDIQETRSTKMPSQGQEIVRYGAGGSLEFNLRSRSLGYLLKSLLGSVSSATKAGETVVYEHTFNLLASDPSHPSLSLSVSKPNIQSYQYVKALVKMLEIRTPVDDLVNATVEFVAAQEAEHAAFTPSFPSTDTYFRQQDVSIKLATTYAGLGAASPIKVKDFSVSLDNGARGNQNVGSLYNDDVLATVMVIEGEFEIDLTDKTLYDVFRNNESRAFRLELTRSDVTIGTASNPKLQLDLPKVTFSGLDEDRPLDDIVTQTISFKAHYSLTDALGVRAILTNDKANYTT